MKDEYGFKKKFERCSADRLIKAFNEDAGNAGWVGARGFFLSALREAFLGTGLDCSSFIDKEGMTIRRKVRRDGKRIIPVSR